MSERERLARYGPEFWLDAAYDRARIPHIWLRTAEGLGIAAAKLDQADQQVSAITFPPIPGLGAATFDRLWKISIAYGGTASMLWGFALENYLKGILIARNPTLVKADPRGIMDLKHDLTPLARQAQIELTSDEELLLEILTKYMIWMGRYPSALTAARQQLWGSWPENSHQLTANLVERLSGTLRDEVKDWLKRQGAATEEEWSKMELMRMEKKYRESRKENE